MSTSEEQVESIKSRLSTHSREITLAEELSIRATLELVEVVSDLTLEILEIKICLDKITARLEDKLKAMEVR